MAKSQVETPTLPELPEGQEWETMNSGLGTEWPFDKQPTLIGAYAGHQVVDSRDPNGDTPDARRDTNCYQFTIGQSDDIWFVWGSATIDMAFLAPDEEFQVRDDIRIGDLFRITYLGKDEIGGGRTVKKFRVQRAVRKPA